MDGMHQPLLGDFFSKTMGASVFFFFFFELFYLHKPKTTYSRETTLSAAFSKDSERVSKGKHIRIGVLLFLLNIKN